MSRGLFVVKSHTIVCVRVSGSITEVEAGEECVPIPWQVCVLVLVQFVS